MAKRKKNGNGIKINTTVMKWRILQQRKETKRDIDFVLDLINDRNDWIHAQKASI